MKTKTIVLKIRSHLNETLNEELKKSRYYRDEKDLKKSEEHLCRAEAICDLEEWLAEFYEKEVE